MHFFDRKLSIAFSTVTLGAALALVGCDEAPTPTADNAPTGPATPMASVQGMTLAPDAGMPPVIFLRKQQAAFVHTDSSVNTAWAAHWEQEAQPHEAALIQDPRNAALFQNFVAQFDGLRNSSLADKLEAVNQAVNGYVTYTNDIDLYGRNEYWASPIETLKQHRGDCEDFAILKYYTLRAMGVADNRLFLAAVNSDGASSAGANHVVLLANVEEEGNGQSFVVLDNNNDKIYDVDDSRYSYYHTFNDTGYWGYKADYLAMASAEPVKTENNGRAVEKDGALVIDGGKIVIRRDGSVLVNGAVYAERPAPQPKAPG